MLKFCQKCGTILLPKKKSGKVKWYCKKCNKYYDPKPREKVNLSTKLESKKEVIVIDKTELKGELPVTKILCPNCGNEEAYWWMQQTRSADEPPTIFYQCTKCGYRWRVYS